MIKIIAYFLFFACINANQLKVPSQYSTIQAKDFVKTRKMVLLK